MKQPEKTATGPRVDEIIESRSPAGRQELVQGWQNLLKKILQQMAPYMREGHLITFRSINEQERVIFTKLSQTIAVPDAAGAIYMPPSVRHQMLYHRPESEPQPIPDHSPDNPPDEGVVLACRKVDISLIVNALLAKPPFAPAIDVYDEGQLLAGYVYNTIDECIGEMTKVLQIHLHSETRQK
ncbi:hypothetical protein D1AOALGA4SA_9030 [Olavius algarvensis Delta 1 endosymbiont]|nr:hypothetical protein D1AOALGA4SA_9030 [Olavius algarvensis Delta 1 endosymbiont]